MYTMCKTRIYYTILILLVSTGCSVIFPVNSTPTAAPTSTPERLELIKGEIDACLLLSSVEVESISDIKVTSHVGAILKTSCQYISVKDGEIILAITTNTDATLKRRGESYSAVEMYEIMKRGDLRLQKEIPEIKVEDIDNFGDQAYFRESVHIDINVLKNKIVYWFSTRTIANGGIGYDTLMKLAKIALQRMP